MKIPQKEKTLQEHDVISIREAQTDHGTMYYLMDENLDLMPFYNIISSTPYFTIT